MHAQESVAAKGISLLLAFKELESKTSLNATKAHDVFAIAPIKTIVHMSQIKRLLLE